MPRPSHYVHGAEPRELERLGLMNRLLNAGELRELALEAGARVLDVGSGTALFAREMARAVAPGGRVIGVERDERQLAEARRQLAGSGEAGLVELRSGEAHELPLAEGEWGSFDVAHARFLLEHVPFPLEVVEGMVRAVRPGGRVVLADDDHDLLRLWPPAPLLEAVWRAYQRGFESAGNDPAVGRKLVSLLHRAGARPLRCTWIFFGGCAGSPELPLVALNLRGILEGARESILAHLHVQDLDRGLDELSSWSLLPDATFWFALSYAEGRR